jgi:hypothetical protein
MRGEGVRESESGCEGRTEHRRTEDVERNEGSLPRCGVDARNARPAVQVSLKLQHVFWKAVGCLRRPSERQHRGLVGPGGAAETEVDPPRMHRFEGPELFGDDEGGVVRQHDPAGTETDRLGVGRNVGDQDARGGRGDRGHVVVLGVPDPCVAGPFGQLRQLDARAEAVARCFAGADRCQVENRDWKCHQAALFACSGYLSAGQSPDISRSTRLCIAMSFRTEVKVREDSLGKCWGLRDEGGYCFDRVETKNQAVRLWVRQKSRSVAQIQGAGIWSDPARGCNTNETRAAGPRVPARTGRPICEAG